MTTENDFLPFAVGVSANVLTQAQYAALTTLLQEGFQSGIAPSVQLNKVWRQSSIMAAVLAQFIVNNSGQTAIDDGTTATLLTNLQSAVSVVARQNPVLADTGTANTYAVANAAAFTAYPTVSGLVLDVSILTANTGASTLNVDGLGTKPILGLGLQALQGGELIAKGVASLLYVVASTVNSGNGAFIILECTGGAQQIAPATASQQAVQFGQVSGVVGSVRNLAMSVTTASATATLTADEIIVETALGGLRYCLPSFSKTINLGTTGAGGMDTGSAPVSGFVALYAIYNPTTGTAALLATNATSSAQPNVYGGANMPSGYTASALVSVWPTNSSSQFVVGSQIDRRLFLGATQALNTTASGSVSALTISAIVPKNTIIVYGTMIGQTSGGSAAGSNAYVSGNSVGVGGIPFNGLGSCQSFFEVPISTPQTIYWSGSTNSGTETTIINICGYSI